MTELSSNVGLGEGWDIGFGFGVHLSDSLVEQTERSQNARLKGRDPRVGMGWSTSYASWSFRPFAQVFLPLGDASNFAGEPGARTFLGSAVDLDVDFLRWSSQVAILHRKRRHFSSTVWGSQLSLGTGIFVPMINSLEVGTQLILQPVLAFQEGSSGSMTRLLIPGEALGGLRYRIGAISCGLMTGIGLPLTRASGVHAQRKYARAPTTPTYRGFFDLTYEN